MELAHGRCSRQCAAKHCTLLFIIAALCSAVQQTTKPVAFGKKEDLTTNLKDDAPSAAEIEKMRETLKGMTLGGKGGSTGALFEGAVVRKYPVDQLLFRGGGTATGTASGVPQEDRSASTWARQAGTFDCQNWSVVTTIYDMTPAIERTMHLGKDWCTVIVADRKTPQEAKYFSKFAKPPNVAFIGVPEQEQLARDKTGLGAYVASVPWNHFGRKNLGYLFAISQGAQHVFDFDDDNALKPKTMPLGPWRSSSGLVDTLTKRPGREGAFNPYPFMGSTSKAAWPRGFPLPSITEKDSYAVDVAPLVHWDDVGIFQAVADKDPDVDALYRLTVRELHFDFAAKHDPVALPAGVLAPYNAQACVHTRNAFWGMLLPISVPGRVSDIWRSYITQRLLWDVGMRIAFTEPTVVQDRTAHNFLRDMDAELDLYFKTPALLTFLQKWDGSAMPTIQERTEKLFADLYERGYLERADVLAVGKWLRALESAGYAFPKVLAQSDPASHQKAISPAAAKPPSVPDSIAAKAAVPQPYPMPAADAKNVLVTGITGMIGSNVAKALIRTGRYKVYGVIRWRANLSNLAGIQDKINVVNGDILDSVRMREIMREVQPAFVYHFAAQAINGVSYKTPELTLEVNMLGTLNILEAIRVTMPGDRMKHVRVLLAGSSTEYGQTADEWDGPIPESAPMKPVSPYGVSKVGTEMLGMQYFRSFGIPVIVARFFIQVAAGGTEHLALQEFSRQVAMIERGLQQPVLLHGNLQTKRDMTDINEAAPVVVKLAELGSPGEAYNFGSSKAYRMQDLLDELLAQSSSNITAKLDKSRLRVYDEKILLSDISKLRAVTGWKPEPNFKRTIGQVLNHWRQEVDIRYPRDGPKPAVGS